MSKRLLGLGTLFFLSALYAAELPPDVASEVAKFQSAEPKTRQQALSALGRMGDKARPALPQIIAMLNDKVTWVQTKALMVIAELGPDENAIEPVLPFLEKFPEIRSLAVDVFIKLGEKAVPALSLALKDEKRAEGACETLGAIGKAAKAAAPQLAELSQKAKTKPVKDAAAKALRLINK